MLHGPLTRADIPELCERVDALLGAGEAGVVVCEVGARVCVDAVAVDALARVALTARRHGARVALRDPTGALSALVTWMGLGEVVGGSGSALEAGGEPEHREERGGVQEEADPGDAPLA